ncbi:DUF885 domain-containing protein [Lipingzhangella sp. LS1_29]|uniref:DUF885 domain-containing protein n=1 Tax=Lipingzhangella rawalii TaxID=2055835 RepID=A0ABU2H2M6_9ACTN|nr:DUF885 domain-containing protein [Lipingzhangella rawalii]MDS1269075.1 DUF885 domain-containing protein [Lipingzhangella rawalii]
MTAIYRLCSDYVDQRAALDPVGASISGVSGSLGPATDYSPEGYGARAELIDTTLATLATLDETGPADRRAAAYLRERLEAQRAWHEAGEPYRNLSAPLGLLHTLHTCVQLMPRATSADWQAIVARLNAIPGMLRGWRKSLEYGLDQGLAAARRQAVEAAAQAERFVASEVHQDLIVAHGDGAYAVELRDAVDQARHGYVETARYLREDYAPRAATADGVGPERYAVASRMYLGADIDAREAYAWGWAELERIEAEMAAEADRVRPGATVDEATAILDATEYVEGSAAYHDWLRSWHDWAIRTLDGTHFDIADPLRTIEVALAHGSSSGAAYYTPPSEDLSRPGRTWWPVGAQQRFTTWNELSTVFHEGVPGHHLQLGANRALGDSLSRFQRFTQVSGHAEGWALYAERLADELGWFTEPGTRLGMLGSAALRAARVVIDIGVHLDLPRDDGHRWTFENAQEFLRTRGREPAHRVHPEVVRYFGWPGQAISYKLGERAWLAAREEARRQPDFDLKAWHTAALELGPVGLDTLARELRGDAGSSYSGD